MDRIDGGESLELGASPTPTPQINTDQPIKRGPGRPRKNPDDNSAPPKRGPGRPPKAKAKGDNETLAKNIVGLHMIAAMGTGLPELQISDNEGTMLANAINAVADEYGLDVGGKTGAALQLFGAMGMIYAPRAFAIMKRVEAQKREAAKASDDAPNDMPQAPFPGHGADLGDEHAI